MVPGHVAARLAHGGHSGHRCGGLAHRLLIVVRKGVNHIGNQCTNGYGIVIKSPAILVRCSIRFSISIL